MDRKSSGFAIRHLAVIVLLAAAFVPTVRGDTAATVTMRGQVGNDRAASAPIVLAQGRCFNGHCF
ncbi:MAG: hypothetical protein WBW74_15435 [Xanthobacteraceae bacterium]